MSATHLTFSTAGRAPIAPGEGCRRALVRVILRVAGGRLALFCIVDDHVHVVLLCGPDEVGRLARALLLAIRAASPAPVEPAHVRPVTTRAHAEWLLGYLLTQVDHHGLDAHPALWSGSCFAELAGARAAEGWAWNVKELLPRFLLREAFAAVGLAEAPAPADDATVRALGAWRLASAAAFAAGVVPALDGNDAAVAAARRTIARVGLAAGIPPADLRAALNMASRQVGRMARREPLPKLELAVRKRLAIEEAVRAAR